MRKGLLTTALLVMTATVGCTTNKGRTTSYDPNGKCNTCNTQATAATTQPRTATVATTNGQPMYPGPAASSSTSMPYNQPNFMQPNVMTPNSGQTSPLQPAGGSMGGTPSAAGRTTDYNSSYGK